MAFTHYEPNKVDSRTAALAGAAWVERTEFNLPYPGSGLPEATLKFQSKVFPDANNAYRGILSIQLPAGPEGKLAEVLTNPDHRVADEPLTETWGFLLGDCRYRTLEVSSATAEGAAAAMMHYVTEACCLLSEVKNAYLNSKEYRERASAAAGFEETFVI